MGLNRRGIGKGNRIRIPQSFRLLCLVGEHMRATGGGGSGPSALDDRVVEARGSGAP